MTAARKPDEDRGEDPVELPPQPIEYSSTTVLPPGCRLRVDGYGALVIEVAQEEAGQDGEHG